MISNRYRYGAGGAVVMVVALGAGYYVGHHGMTPAFADVPNSPTTIAAADGAPSVPGLCVLSQNAVYANAKVGQAATARYRELNAQLRNQLLPQQQAIQDEAKKLEAAQATIPAAEFQRKQQALAQRVQALRESNGQDAKELEATRLKAVRQIAEWSNPVIAEAYKARHCGALFSRDTMLVGNPGMDLTPIVVAGLDGKVTTMSFDLDKSPADTSAISTKAP